MPENKQISEKKEPIKKEYKFDFDELKMYFRYPHLVKMLNNNYIEIRQPSIGEILELGDREVYSWISPFITNTTACRVQLWDAGVDWNKISDYELFATLVTHAEHTDFILQKVDFVENPKYDTTLSEEDNLKKGNKKTIKTYSKIDFSKLEVYINPNKNDTASKKDFFLYDPKQNIILDEETYMHIREYLRMMFNRHPKEELAKGKTTKRWIIDEERKKLQKGDGKNHSVLLPIVSALLNHPGFKYDLDGIKNLGIFAFMDSANRLQVYEQCTAFMKGMYSGMMDTSKLAENELIERTNWLQDLYEK